MRRLLAALCLTALPVAAEPPDPAETLEAWDALYVAKEFAEAEVFLLKALRDAREAGPLNVRWAYGMSVAAYAMMRDSCKFARSQALYDEAIAIAEDRGQPEDLAWMLHMRAYHLARFGQRDAARADIARAVLPPETVLRDNDLAELEALLAAEGRVGDSPGFASCKEISETALPEAVDVMDIETLSRLARSLSLPAAFETDPRILKHNGDVAWALKVIDSDASSPDVQARFNRLVQSAAEPGSQLSALRADIVADPVLRDALLNSLWNAAPNDRQAKHVQESIIALRAWTLSVPAEEQGVAPLSFRISEAKRANDYFKVQMLSLELMIMKNLSPVALFQAYTDSQIYKALDAHESGRVTDHAAELVSLASAITRYDKVSVATRIVALERVALTLGTLGDQHNAMLILAFAWRQEQELLRRSSVSGNAAGFAASRNPHTKGLAVATAFQLLLDHASGAVPPCVDIFGRTTCTLTLESPP